MPKQAMIFAAGEGRRMRPLTLTTPKPLLPVQGKPLIEWHLERLALAGIEQVIINVNYLHEQIIETLGTGARWGLEIIYSVENSLLETGGGLLQAQPYLQDAPLIVVNADIWCTSLPQFPPVAANELAFLWLVPNPSHHPEGDFYFCSATKQIACTPQTGFSAHTFMGLSRLSPEILQPVWLKEAYGQVPAKGEGFKLAPLLRHLISQGRVAAAVYPETWVDVGTPERLEELNS